MKVWIQVVSKIDIFVNSSKYETKKRQMRHYKTTFAKFWLVLFYHRAVQIYIINAVIIGDSEMDRLPQPIPW